MRRTILAAAALTLSLVLPGPAAGAKTGALAGASAPTQAKKQAATCAALPAGSGTPWKPGERLAFDIDVMGAQAGSLSMMALPPVGKGTSKEHVFRALAASNSFFSKVRRVRGRSTAYVRDRDMRPRRYEEMTEEGGSFRSADVVFKGPGDGKVAQLAWSLDQRKGTRNLRYLNDAFDPVSIAYYLRTLDLEAGQEICFDSYGIRRLWRVKGKVVGLEDVRVPAGNFKAWHLEGIATRTDSPGIKKEIHIWISADEARLPVAALGVIDLGAVRAQLTHVGVGPDANEDRIVADLVRPKASPPSPRPAPSKPRVR